MLENPLFLFRTESSQGDPNFLTFRRQENEPAQDTTGKNGGQSQIDRRGSAVAKENLRKKPDAIA